MSNLQLATVVTAGSISHPLTVRMDGTTTAVPVDMAIEEPTAVGSRVLTEIIDRKLVVVAVVDVPTTPALRFSGNMADNGGFGVAQRPAVTGHTAGNAAHADRWFLFLTTLGTWSISANDANISSTELRGARYLQLTCTTADAAPAAGDEAVLFHRMEGQRLQHLRYGSAFAIPFTVGFFARSAVTGTHILNCINGAATRNVSIPYTILVANTWEFKTCIIPGDTNTVIPNTTATGLSLNWYMAAGSNFTSGTLRSTWTAFAQADRAVGQVNVAATNNNEFRISDVMIVPGAVPVPYIPTPYPEEVDRCLRYYYKTIDPGTFATIATGFTTVNGGGAADATIGKFWIPHLVQSRAVATSIDHGTIANLRVHYGVTAVALGVCTFLGSQSSQFGTLVEAKWTATIAAATPAFIQQNGSASGYIAMVFDL